MSEESDHTAPENVTHRPAIEFKETKGAEEQSPHVLRRQYEQSKLDQKPSTFHGDFSLQLPTEEEVMTSEKWARFRKFDQYGREIVDSEALKEWYDKQQYDEKVARDPSNDPQNNSGGSSA